MNNFDKIINTIEKEHITPKPKWVFQSKNLTFWVLFITALLIGSIAFSIVLFSIQQTDFLLLKHLKHSSIEAILVLLPYFWLIALLAFTFLGFFSFKNFKNAYKYSWFSILGVNILMSVNVGTLLFLSGGAQFLETVFANQVEMYQSVEEQKLKHWMHPEAGYLAGEIVESKTDTLIVKDFSNNNWLITYHDIFIPPILELEAGEKIKIMGKKQSETHFSAQEIRPWKAFGKQQKGKKNKK